MDWRGSKETRGAWHRTPNGFVNRLVPYRVQDIDAAGDAQVDLLPIQFTSDRKLMGEELLMLAMLAQAAGDMTQPLIGTHRLNRASAESWVRSDNRSMQFDVIQWNSTTPTFFFPFAMICDHFGLEAETIRRQILSIRPQEKPKRRQSCGEARRAIGKI